MTNEDPIAANILDGKLVAAFITSSLKKRIDQGVATGLRPPCLAVVLLGDEHASTLYVNNKQKACLAVGIHSVPHFLSAQTTEAELLALITQLNTSPDIDGILVQLPLPPHIHATSIIEHIDPNKDVDGFHPLNMGRLAQGHPKLRPCTPLGIMRLLEHYQLNVSGKSALVIGASNIVGRPMALELLLAKATVTIAHHKTQNLEQIVRQAELIVSATGVPNLIQSTWLSKNQIIIDVGIHRSSTHKICGDIEFTQAEKRVAWITPVPGGVGPMTIAMLLENTTTCWENFI